MPLLPVPLQPGPVCDLQVRPKQAKLCLFYPADGSSEEDVDVAALVRDGHIAVKQERAHGQPLHKGDIPVDEQDRLTATFIEGEITSGWVHIWRKFRLCLGPCQLAQGR